MSSSSFGLSSLPSDAPRCYVRAVVIYRLRITWRKSITSGRVYRDASTNIRKSSELFRSSAVVRSNDLVTSMTDVASAIVEEKWSTRGKIKQVPIDFVFRLRRSSNFKWYPIEYFRRSMTILQHSFCHVVFCTNFDHQFQKYIESNFKRGLSSSGLTSFSVFFRSDENACADSLLKNYVRSRPRRFPDDFGISCIRRVLASIFVVHGAAQDSLHALLLILLYHTLFGNSVDA